MAVLNNATSVSISSDGNVNKDYKVAWVASLGACSIKQEGEQSDIDNKKSRT